MAARGGVPPDALVGLNAGLMTYQSWVQVVQLSMLCVSSSPSKSPGLMISRKA